jgi:hypothetical protein
VRTSDRSTLPTCLRHDVGDQLLHALAVARRTGNRPALVILQTQGELHFFPTVQTYIFVRRHERDLPFVGCANSPPASTTVTRDAAADLVIAPDPPEWEAQVAGTLRNHHTLRFLAVLSFLGRFHRETSFRWVPEAPLAENVPQRATYVGRYSVLSERRRLENLTRREQKGALNLRPRHSSGDTTIIPLSGLVNRWRTGSGSAPAGVAQSEGKIGKIFLFREKIKRGWDFLMRILLAFLAYRCVGRGVR